MKRSRSLSVSIIAGIIIVGGIFLIAKQSSVPSNTQDKTDAHIVQSGSGTRELYQKAETLADDGREDQARSIYEDIAENDQLQGERDKAFFALARDYEAGGNLPKAREYYRQLVTEEPSSDLVNQAQHRIWDINIKLLLSPEITDRSFLYEVKSGDTLERIAKKFNTTVDLLKASNNLQSDLIRIGERLKVNNMALSILVDKSQNILILKGDEEVLKIYDVATGKNNCTPVGTFKIVTKLENPTWYTAGAVIPPDSPENILGSRWMGIDEKGYGIHGTTQPDKIGEQVTSGCIRMKNEDVEELYKIVPRGTEVVIID